MLDRILFTFDVAKSKKSHDKVLILFIWDEGRIQKLKNEYPCKKDFFMGYCKKNVVSFDLSEDIEVNKTSWKYMIHVADLILLRKRLC